SGVGSGAVLDSLHFDTLASTLDEPSINSRGDSDGENPDAVPFPTPGLYDRYDHVLVDEFQDTNGSQLELLKLLMPADSPNVFCVGDDAQSIYGFRGARAENVGEFEEDFPDAKVVHLGTNYRSAQPVVTLAEAALAREKTTREREKQKVPDDRTGAVLHHVAASARDEGAWISDRIAELSQVRGVPFEQIAILRRSLLDADPLVEALKARSIPVDFSSASGRTSARRLAILLAASAGDDPSPKDASRALVSPLAGVLPETALALRAVAESSSLSVFGMVRENSFPAGVSEKEKDRARKVVATVDAARGRDGFLEKLDVLWKGLPGTRELFEAHRGDPDCAMALSDAAAFLRSARSYAAASREPSVRGFLAAGEMIHDDSDTWAPSAPTVEGAVRILTVHASKGLEFEAVFLSGLSDEKFPIRSRGVRFVDPGILAGKGPTPKANLEEIHLNEERRLFYVALTRAKTRLYLTGVEETADDGRKASPFLRELEDLLVKLAAPESSRRFWTSREEAVEELRRLACDRTSPDHDRFAACRALAEMDERPDDPDDPWWRYVEETEGKGPPPENGVLSEREVVDLSECPRRAFLERLTSRAGRRMSGGSASFGAAFSDGLRAFLLGEHDSLEEAVRAAVEASKFGGAAFTEHWLREARNMAVGCEAWAREVRRLLVEPGGEWEREFAGRKVRGRHGPVIEREGKTVALRISTGGSHLTKKEAATDAGLSLKALGAGAEEAEIHYAREVQKRSGAPKRVTLDASKGWRERFEEDVQTWLEELAAGEHPPRPKDEKLCDRCAFKNVCPRHREDEVWVG
ncbi:MAG: 3'-5' exonuclease, partial [Rubrobacteraceae bacterium]